jgi:hypothetical protein
LIRRSRFAVAIALVLALGVATVAFADGASDNEAGVLGKVSPSKLDKKKFKPVTFYAGVTTSTTHAVPGQQNAEQVQLDFGKNVKFDLKAADTCSAAIAGTTTDQAKSACPAGSVIGTGVAHANLGGGPDQVSDVAVTVFNGPTANHIRLHAYSPSLGAANTQVVDADIIKSPLGGKFGQALYVKDAPDLGGDAFMLTLFDATISKSSKTVLARCGKDKKFYWQNTTTYDDGSKDVSPLLSQKCKQKKSKKHHH